MRFELKVLVSFTLLVFVELSMINVYTLLILKEELESSLFKEIEALVNKTSDHLIVSPKPIEDTNFTLKTYLDDVFVYVKKGYLQERLRTLTISLLVWEFVVVVTVILLAYMLIRRFYSVEKDRRDFLNLLLLSITHRLGNFLAVQRVNLEILGRCENASAVERMLSQTDKLRKDFDRTVYFMERIQRDDEVSKEVVSVRPVLLETTEGYLEVYGRPLKVILHVEDLRIYTNPDYFISVIDIVMENAVKYADSFVHIKSFVGRRHLCIAVRNDIGKTVEGRGVGVQIAKYIMGKLGGDLRIRIRGGFYTTVLIFRR